MRIKKTIQCCFCNNFSENITRKQDNNNFCFEKCPNKNQIGELCFKKQSKIYKPIEKIEMKNLAKIVEYNEFNNQNTDVKISNKSKNLSDLENFNSKYSNTDLTINQDGKIEKVLINANLDLKMNHNDKLSLHSSKSFQTGSLTANELITKLNILKNNDPDAISLQPSKLIKNNKKINKSESSFDSHHYLNDNLSFLSTGNFKNSNTSKIL